MLMLLLLILVRVLLCWLGVNLMLRFMLTVICGWTLRTCR